MVEKALFTRRMVEPAFFARPALTVAQELLGKHLVRRWRNVEQSAVIHEVEAYIGPHDLACHGRFGRTARTEVMFGPAGVWYVYLVLRNSLDVEYRDRRRGLAGRRAVARGRRVHRARKAHQRYADRSAIERQTGH